ncbi:MAG: hemolysin family protein [Propionibacteriaceae bacterium]|nr:hemolysin family protein [Propionibacteriaceae bacterium]
MLNLWVNIALILVFILIGGVFAAAEMALVSLRDSQLQQLATRGARGRKVAALASRPNRFLSAIQIGVTFSGFLSASLGAVTLSDKLAPVFEKVGLPVSIAWGLAVVLVTVVIAYFSIVIGELTAKRLGMQRAVSIALALAGFVDLVAILARPLIWLLGVSTDLLVRLLGGDPATARVAVSEEELRQMVTTSTTLTDEERAIVDEVFGLGERSLREVMVPRTEAEFLDGDLPAYRAIAALETATHSRFPVTGQSVDDILGFVHIRDLMYLDPANRATPMRQLARPIMSLPDTVKVLPALAAMRRNGAHLVIVRDEYGGTAGLVTLEDLVEELVGEIRDEYDSEGPAVVSGADQVEVEGLMTLEQFADLTGLHLPEGPYDTVAGFWVALKGELASQGESVTTLLPGPDVDSRDVPVELTVTEMDARRAARICVRRLDN